MATRDKYSIDYQGLSNGNHCFTFDFESDLFALFPESGIESGEGKIEIELTKNSSFMELFVKISGKVELECDRCLDMYSQPVDFEGGVIVKLTDEQGDYDGDIIWLSPRESKLDLSEWIYESIILGLPLQRVHLSREDCNADALKYLVSTEPESEDF